MKIKNDLSAPVELVGAVGELKADTPEDIMIFAWVLFFGSGLIAYG